METGNKIKVVFEAADALLNQTEIGNCHLSILHSGKSLSFALLNKDKMKFILLGAYESDISDDHKDLFEFLDRFTELPGEISYAYTDEEFTIIPQPLFDENKVNDYLSFMVTGAQTAKYTQVGKWVVVNNEERGIEPWLNQRLPGVKIINSSQIAICYYQSTFKNSDETIAFAHAMGGKLEITVVDSGSVVLHNVFNFHTEEDFVYFILSVYEQLKLNPKQVEVRLSGWITRLSKEVALLKKYVKYVEWEERPAKYTYSHTFKSMEEHTFNRLFQQSTCAL